ncbi:MAG: recombination mediator RecR [Patescibacteria group bacterium]
MSSTPKVLELLIQELAALPGFGPKSAERLAYFLLKQPPEVITNLVQSLKTAREEVVTCNICQRFATESPCAICHDTKRDPSLICVVAESHNIPIIEKTHAFSGKYHVLNGVLSALEGITPDKLKIKELLKRLKNDGVKEVILALNPDLDGETTSLYLTKIIKPLKIKVTKLARGLPMGADLEYADEVTLESAIVGRNEV